MSNNSDDMQPMGLSGLPEKGARARRAPRQRRQKDGRTALFMAGGTGGHIFPGLALAQALRERGWRVHWLGGRGSPEQPSMESQKVPAQGIDFYAIDFSGVRGKGWKTSLVLPWKLLRACWQSWRVFRRVQPDVVIGLGGYITLPGGLVSALTGRLLLLHEQNAVAGWANRVLGWVAEEVFTAFPNVLKKARWVGNLLRPEFTKQPEPLQRFSNRSGPLQLLVVGGSLGAQALNTLVPQALALIPAARRPQVLHQSGAQHIQALQISYATLGVQAEVTDFIADTAQAFALADLVICRAGASTVTEIAAVGAPALFVPFPAAVDDHQTRNAEFLVAQGGGWLLQQKDLTPQVLAAILQKVERYELLAIAQEAYATQRSRAVASMVRACEELVE